MSLLVSINPEVFREYDIRGIATVDLSPDFAESLGLAYAQLIRGRKPANERNRLTVAVGKDCRLSSDSYEEGLVNGLIKGGLDVIRLGLCPTPLTYFSLYHLDLDGGLMVTASHNPPEHNGFKICVGKDAIYGAEIQKIRSIMESEVEPFEQQGSVSDFDIISTYLSYQKHQFPSLKGKKIVIDCGNGMASMIVASKLFHSLGVEVLDLYCELDGTFPNHTPDPTKEDNLVDLISAVKESHADFGIGFDGDADRLGVIDENGQLLLGDELMVIFSRAILNDNPGSTIISEVKASSRLFNFIEREGGKALMWKVGHSHIKAKMKETGAILGGELSGHICFSDRYFGFDDAIYASLRLLEIAIKTSKPFSSLLDDLPNTFSTPELRIPFEEKYKFKLVDMVKDILLSDPTLKSSRITCLDGARIDFEDGWGLIRASNTQAALTFRFEALTEKRLLEVREIFENAVNTACWEMDHQKLRLE